MDVIIIIILVALVAAFYLYITGKMYLRETFSTETEEEAEEETDEDADEKAGYKKAAKGVEKATLKSFQQKVQKPSNEYTIGEAGEVIVYDDGVVQKPYMTNEDLYGDYEDPTYVLGGSGSGSAELGGSYEQDFIFMQEGGQNPSRDAINAARRRFPYDWSSLPPSSSQFQMQQALFAKEPVNQAAPYTAETFKDMEAADLLPPDAVAEAERQAKLLASYKPISASDFGAPTTESVEELVAEIYKPRGLVPSVKQQGVTNIYEIYETKEIEPKIVYEDDASQQRGVPNPLEPLRPDVGKQAAPSDTSLGLAPASEKTKAARNSYATYDPSLEAMFGPRMSWQQWG
jgi:hypothetical protein